MAARRPDGSDPLARTRDVILAEGDIVVPIDLSTEDTGVFTHEFRSGASSLPSLAVEIGMPEVPSLVRLRPRARTR